MAAIAGIKTKKNLKGQVTHVTIDVKKHQDKIQALTEIGVLPKTKFQERCEGAMTLEELRTSMYKFINDYGWKK